MTGAEETMSPLDSKHKGGHERVLFKANFLALPVTDPLDGERVLCYRSFSSPAPHALILKKSASPARGTGKPMQKIAIQGIDYTSALDSAQPLTIERKLNEPSVCRFALSLPSDGSLATPLRCQAVAVNGDDGTVYFTGYIAQTPLPQYAGMALEGPRSRISVQAISDELLLDQAGIAPTRGTAGQSAGAVMQSLVTRTGMTALSTQGLTLDTTVSNFTPEPNAPWSKSAGQVASQARAAYRAISGALALNAVPATVHSLSENDGSLNLASLALHAGARRALANDITVCGEHEPGAYVTEHFIGNGITASFDLSETPYFPSASKADLIRELFDETSIDARVWANPGPIGRLSLGDGGLVMQGGNGFDGETALTWLDRVEMGGTLLLEATGVTLAAGSNGILPGFFANAQGQGACTAGFRATAAAGNGVVTLQPLVMGSLAGSTYPVNPANQYALRLRVYCAETQRQLSLYRACGDDGPIILGGQTNQPPAHMQFEIQEYVNGVAGMPVTLYDGAVANLPDACVVVAASSFNLFGSMRSLNLTNLGSGWVTSTPPNGGPRARRVGTTAQAAECQIERSGRLVFFNGCTPVVGEQIAVSYRTVQRAVGRAVNAANQQALADAGLPSVCCWSGSVTSPAGRSSQDCRNAAQALSLAAASANALWSGTFKGTRADFAADVWPGDAITFTAPSMNFNTQVVVRAVHVTYRASCPDLVEYVIAFANDWADDLAIKTSETVPEDAWLPAPANPTLLANLNGLSITSINGDSVTVEAGMVPPLGGGFEVRRRDHVFMPGQDTDLVLGTTQPTFTFVRGSASDRYYIRMYDGASPPHYSEFSAALYFNLPLGS